jgi:hypothetical protein
MANPVGAPRYTTPPKEKCVELGKDLVQWATEETSEIRTSFSFWYALKHDIIYTEWKLLKQKEEFRPYYEKARAALASKLHKNQLEKGLAHRYIRMYDQELSDLEDSDKQFESNLKKDEVKQASTEDTTRLNALMDQLSSLRSDSNIATNNINKDVKS